MLVTVAVILCGCGSGGPKGGEAAELRLLVPSPGPPLPAQTGAYVWAVGDPRFAFASTDGGATWTTSHPQKTDEPDVYRGVAFSDTRHGWAVGQRTIAASSDGGATWTTHTVATGSLHAVACTDAKHVWVVGGQGDGNLPLVLASSDGGTTWSEQHVATHCDLGSVVFVDSRHGWMVGQDVDGPWCFVLATTDGGAHWHVQYRAARTIQLAGLAASDTRHAWVAGWSQGATDSTPGLIIATTDGGAHWKTQPSGRVGALLSIAFPDARHGWATGQKGVILATRNGGKTWVAQHSGVSRDLRNATFSDLTHGWAVVDKWGLLATENGGRTWTVVLPGEPGRMVWDVAALNKGYAK